MRTEASVVITLEEASRIEIVKRILAGESPPPPFEYRQSLVNQLNDLLDKIAEALVQP